MEELKKMNASIEALENKMNNFERIFFRFLEEEKEQAEREAELAELEAETGKEAPEVPVIEEKKDSNEEA